MRNYAEKGELCGIVRRTEICAISHSPHLNVASDLDNKTRHNEYLSTNPFAARKLFINMRGFNSRMGC